MSKPLPPHVGIVDGALSSALAQCILDYAIAEQEWFLPATVGHQKHEHSVASDQRHAMRCSKGLGDLEGAFRTAMLGHFESLVEQTSITPFDPDDLEIELVAHRDGDFFAEHIDTYTGAPNKRGTFARILSTVVYFQREPSVYSGGEISFRSLGNDEEWRVAPRHNRLVAFASFDPHEVLPVSIPGNAFEDARFSVNCWFSRSARTGVAKSAFRFSNSPDHQFPDLGHVLHSEADSLAPEA